MRDGAVNVKWLFVANYDKEEVITAWKNGGYM